MKVAILVTVLVLMSTYSLQAKVQEFPKVSISVKDISETTKGAPNSELSSDSLVDSVLSLGDALDSAIMVADKLIALGERVWKIVDSGRPVVNMELAPSVSVLPLPEAEASFAFHEMEHWSLPKTKEITIEYKNKFGIKVVDLKVIVSFQHSGSYQGKGAYLTGVSIYPGNLSTLWGYNVSAHTFLDSITNRGTSENPIAGATFGISHTVKTAFKEQTSIYKFHVTGNGELVILNL